MKNTILILAFILTTVLGYSQKEKDLKFNEATNLIDATYYFDNGEVSQKGTFDQAGKLQGEWISYNEAGQKISVGYYEHGLKTGKWLFWDQNNTLREVEFANNSIASVTNTENSSGIVSKD